MADDERKALVVQGPRSLAEVGAGARNILSSVVSDALNVVSSREKALTSTLFRIGSYEFREPDYSQILIWARALGIDPMALVNTLEKISCSNYRGHPKVVFTVEQGAIVSLAWDVVALPLKKFDWVTGLTIREFAVFGKEVEHPNFLLQLPSLRLLLIVGLNLTKLDLSNVTNLAELRCERNKLTELELCNMPNLTTLICFDNELTELDLSGLSELTTLWCFDNKLTDLNLSNVPKLRDLACDGAWATDEDNRPTYEGNRLTHLDLSNVPNLTSLQCNENQLTEVDLRNVPNLAYLNCAYNHLADLDLCSMPNLTALYCDYNQLTEFDLSKVPNLTKFHCKNNLITELDVTANKVLAELHCDPSVRVVKFRSQNFKRYPPPEYPPMRYWFNEGRNELFPMAIPPIDSADCIEVAEADYIEYVALARAEAAKGVANDDE